MVAQRGKVMISSPITPVWADNVFSTGMVPGGMLAGEGCTIQNLPVNTE